MTPYRPLPNRRPPPRAPRARWLGPVSRLLLAMQPAGVGVHLLCGSPAAVALLRALVSTAAVLLVVLLHGVWRRRRALNRLRRVRPTRRVSVRRHTPSALVNAPPTYVAFPPTFPSNRLCVCCACVAASHEVLDGRGHGPTLERLARARLYLAHLRRMVDFPVHEPACRCGETAGRVPA